MTSEQIKNLPVSGPALVGMDTRQAAAVASIERNFLLRELVYQFAVFNERNAYQDAAPTIIDNHTIQISSTPGSACIHFPLGPEECLTCRQKRTLS